MVAGSFIVDKIHEDFKFFSGDGQTDGRRRVRRIGSCRTLLGGATLGLDFAVRRVDVNDVRTSMKNLPERPIRRRRRSRFGYDHRWWGEMPIEPSAAVGRTYWAVSRRPLPCLAFVLPLLTAYELGVLWVGGPSAEALRTGADAWLRRGLASLGLTDHWLLPCGLVVALLVWQAFSRLDWGFRPLSLVGMVGESLVLAVTLVGLSKLVDLGFVALERHGPPVLAEGGSGTGSVLAPLIGFLGAGVYEEALFRLALIPLFYLVLRAMQTPQILASSAAVTASAFLFSLAHHAGTPGEAFTWFAFIFRWLAGVYFAWVFLVRGFGVAVGTHTAYDILVGWLGWHL
jgi:Type II CAAX prenyl endopeptidase Rce1-like